MSNPLYSMFGGLNNVIPNNGVANLLKQFNQFRQGFQGNARDQVQQLLNSGKVSQEQYNRAVQMANMLQQMIGGR